MVIKEYDVDNKFNPDEPDDPCAPYNGRYLWLNKKRNGHDIVINIDQRYKSEGTYKYLWPTVTNCNRSVCEIVVLMICDVNAMVAAKKKHGSSNETSTSVAQTKKTCNRCLSNIYQWWYLFCREQRIWVHRNGCFMLTIVHRKNQENVIVMSRFARNFEISGDRKMI